MDDLHERCQRLESLIRSLDPSLDTEELLRETQGALAGNSGYESGNQRTYSSGSSRAQSGVSTPEPDTETQEEDADPFQADGFEWTECFDEVVSLADGMASLNVDSRDVGYLGRSSAAALLRQVHRLLKAHQQTTGTAGGDFTDVLLQKSPSPTPKLDPDYQLNNSYVNDKMIDAYFVCWQPHYPMIHEAIFRMQVDRWRKEETTPSMHWVALYRMVMTLGAFMSITDHTTGPHADGFVFRAVSRAFTADFFSRGTLEGVQALALMGNYLQKRDSPNTGYNYQGMAVRMALGLGLHRDFAENNKNTLGMEIRRRTWWTLYVFDVGASMTFGRPTIQSDKIFTKMPSNVIDYHMTDKNAPLPPPVNTVTIYSSLIAAAHLSVLMNRVHLTFLVNPRSSGLRMSPGISREMIERFDSQMNRWTNSLPPYFQRFFRSSDDNGSPPSTAKFEEHEGEDETIPGWFMAPAYAVLWRAQNLHMFMYKSFLDTYSYSYIPSTSSHHFDRDKLAPSRHFHLTPYPSHPCPPNAPPTTFIALNPGIRSCLGYAIQTVRSVTTFLVILKQQRKIMWHGIGWYSTYFLFQSALVLVTALLSAPRDKSCSVWREALVEAIQGMDGIKKATGNAGRCHAVLKRCLERIDEVGEEAVTAANSNSKEPEQPQLEQEEEEQTQQWEAVDHERVYTPLQLPIMTGDDNDVAAYPFGMQMGELGLGFGGGLHWPEIDETAGQEGFWSGFDELDFSGGGEQIGEHQQNGWGFKS